MITVPKITEERRLVKEEIFRRLKADPNIGIHEFIAADVNAMGIETPKGTDKRELLSIVRSLTPEQKSKLKKDVIEYNKEYQNALSDYQNGIHSGITKLPGKVIGTIVKGAGIGAGVAGVVNTIAPGLFSTIGGYLVATTPGLAAKLGIAAASIFTPTVVSSGVIIGAGAVAGAIVYTLGKGAIALGKKIIDSSKKSNDGEER